jgi:hypothetical protein
VSTIRRERTPHPRGPVKSTVLGFNKAPLLDVTYEEFLANVGLD